MSTKLSNATSAQSLSSLIHLDTKKAMTTTKRSFGFAVIVDDDTHGGNTMHDGGH
jgi:hypothetical protein